MRTSSRVDFDGRPFLPSARDFFFSPRVALFICARQGHKRRPDRAPRRMSCSRSSRNCGFYQLTFWLEKEEWGAARWGWERRGSSLKSAGHNENHSHGRRWHMNLRQHVKPVLRKYPLLSLFIYLSIYLYVIHALENSKRSSPHCLTWVASGTVWWQGIAVWVRDGYLRTKLWDWPGANPCCRHDFNAEAELGFVCGTTSGLIVGVCAQKKREKNHC